jgi:hypothetical protein
MSEEYERALRISGYLTDWDRAIPEGKGEVARFTRDEFTIILHGTRTVHLTGRGWDTELRFYDAAAKISDDDHDMRLEQQYVNQHSWSVDGYADNE